MERMEHVRGQLLDGDQVVLEPIEGYLGCHAMSNGRKTWFGNFALPADKRPSVVVGNRYKLVLGDGRSGDIYVDIHDDSGHPGDYTAEFQIIGGLKDRRGLRH